MQAYATAHRLTAPEKPQAVQPIATTHLEPTGTLPDTALMDQLFGRIAELIVDGLSERAGVDADRPADDWMDARAAAEYLRIHRDTLRKLAAERAVPVHQDGPGCKLFFRREELDDWRRSSGAARRRLRAVA